MNKSQAYHNYMSSFGLVAYDQASVPSGKDAPTFPYLTYSFAESDFGNTLPLAISLWYYSSSWKECIDKSNQISKDIGRGGKLINYDDGAMWIKRGTSTIQRMTDEENDMIRRAVINIEVEFISQD